jgi:hypothetical protein
MGVVWLKLHPQLEAGSMEQPEKSLESRLTPIALVRRDHRRRDRRSFGQLALAQPSLQAGQLQERGRGGGRLTIRLCHGTIV